VVYVERSAQARAAAEQVAGRRGSSGSGSAEASSQGKCAGRVEKVRAAGTYDRRSGQEVPGEVRVGSEAGSGGRVPPACPATAPPGEVTAATPATPSICSAPRCI